MCSEFIIRAASACSQSAYELSTWAMIGNLHNCINDNWPNHISTIAALVATSEHFCSMCIGITLEGNGIGVRLIPVLHANNQPTFEWDCIFSCLLSILEAHGEAM